MKTARPLGKLIWLPVLVVALLGGVAYRIFASGGTAASPNGSLRQTVANSNGLAVWLPLDGNANDSSGNSYNGTPNNFSYSGTTDGWVPGKFGQGLLFNGTSTYVGVNHDIPRSDTTISFWIKTTADDQGVMTYSSASYLNNAYTDRTVAIGSDGTVRFYVYDGSGSCDNADSVLSSVKKVDDGQWHHVALSVNASSKQVYIDGTLDSSVADGIGSAGAMPYLTIGWGSTNGGCLTPAAAYFNGALDDYRVYTRVLSLPEISALYAGSQPAACDQFCKVDMPLDESVGTAANNASAHGTDATLNNFAFGGSDGWAAGKYGNGLLLASGDYLSSSDTGLPMGNSPRTVSAWVKVPSGGSGNGNMTVFSYGTNGSTQEFFFILSDHGSGHYTLDVSDYGDDITCGTTYVDDNAWHHVAAVYDGASSMALYVDGAQCYNGPSGYTPNTVSNGTAYTGTDGYSFGNASDSIVGTVDDLRVYNTNLSSTDISNLYANNPPVARQSHLVRYWPFNESGGTSTHDFSLGGGLNNFGGTSASGWTTGNFGNGLAFDGTDDYVSLNDLGLTRGTVDMWIKPTTVSGDQRLFSQLTGATTQAGQIALNQTSGESGSLWVWDGSAWQRLTQAGTIRAGVWNQVVITYSGSVATAYVNGAQQLTAASAFAFSGGGASLGGQFLGTTGGTFSGSLDDVRVYSRILSPEEIANQWRVGS